MNILIGDIGNTETKICLIDKNTLKIKKIFYFKSKKILSKYFLKTELKRIIKKKSINKFSLFSSVVPKYFLLLKKFLKKYYKIIPIEIKDQKIKKIIKVNIKNKQQIGSDRIANAVGVYKKYKSNCIVLDFGTATTFDVVDHDGAYVGGVIAPGVNLSLQALHQMAAALPHVDIAKPKEVIGRNTVSCMQSGVFWGYIGLVKEICKKIKEEKKEAMRIVATGGLAPLLQSTEALFEDVEENLTMHGLRLIFDHNKNIDSL